MRKAANTTNYKPKWDYMTKAREPPEKGSRSVTKRLKKNRKIAVALAAQRLMN